MYVYCVLYEYTFLVRLYNKYAYSINHFPVMSPYANTYKTANDSLSEEWHVNPPMEKSTYTNYLYTRHLEQQINFKD